MTEKSLFIVTLIFSAMLTCTFSHNRSKIPVYYVFYRIALKNCCLKSQLSGKNLAYHRNMILAVNNEAKTKKYLQFFFLVATQAIEQILVPNTTILEK